MLLLLPLIFTASTCPEFICNNSPSSLNCLLENSTAIYLNQCNFSYLPYCPFTDEMTSSTCVSLPQSPYNSSWPGDPCNTDSTCVSSMCVNSVCQGLVSSSSCNDTGQCSVGYRCASNNCFIQLSGTNNDYPCNTDYDCVNNAACESGSCVTYFSRGEGESVQDCENGVNWICESGMCYKGLCVSVNVASSGLLPMPCTNDSDCTSNYYNIYPNDLVLNTQCQCGYNMNGTGYCSLFPGDPIQMNYLGMVSKWLQSPGLYECHSYSRFSLKCIQNYWNKLDYLQYAYYYYEATMYPQWQENPDCVKSIITYQYWNAKQAFESFSHGKWIILGLVISYLI